MAEPKEKMAISENKYENYKDIIETIYKMDLSNYFKETFDSLVHYLKEYNKFRVWELVDTLYPAVKLEDNIDDEQISYIKQKLLKIANECK